MTFVSNKQRKWWWANFGLYFRFCKSYKISYKKIYKVWRVTKWASKQKKQEKQGKDFYKKDPNNACAVFVSIGLEKAGVKNIFSEKVVKLRDNLRKKGGISLLKEDIEKIPDGCVIFMQRKSDISKKHVGFIKKDHYKGKIETGIVHISTSEKLKVWWHPLSYFKRNYKIYDIVFPK